MQLVNGVRVFLASQPLLKAPLQLEYRAGYYATPVPHRDTAPAASSRQLISYSPKGDPNGYGAAKATPLDLAMTFGAVAPFQILFQAHVTPANAEEKLPRHATPPNGTFLEPQWLHSRCREEQIQYSVDPRNIQFTQQTVDSYHATIEFIAVVYDSTGAQVNSNDEIVSIDLGPNQYVRAIHNGLSHVGTIAVPVHGDFYLRMAVHDLNSGRIGALEIPAGSIKLLPAQTVASAAKPAP